MAAQFAREFGVRLTKQGLGKIVPEAGILVGSALNWTTLGGIVDDARIAYRQPFLLDNYPRLGHEEAPGLFSDAGQANADEAISVLAELAEAGGLDVH